MGDIVVSSLVGGVGYVERDAYIGAEEQYAEVVAETDAGAQGYVVSEGLQSELGAGSGVVGTQCPYIAGIDEDGSAELSDEGEAPLCVDLELDIARMVYVGIAPGGVVAAGPDASEGKGAEVARSAYMELLDEGGDGAVAIGVEESADEACGKGVARGEAVVTAGLYVAFDILRVGGAQ